MLLSREILRRKPQAVQRSLATLAASYAPGLALRAPLRAVAGAHVEPTGHASDIMPPEALLMPAACATQGPPDTRVCALCATGPRPAATKRGLHAIALPTVALGVVLVRPLRFDGTRNGDRPTASHSPR